MIRLTPDIQTREPERNWGRIHPAITAAMVEASGWLEPRRPGAPDPPTRPVARRSA